MLDYLMSKMTWIVVAVILTSSIVGVYRWQSSSTAELQLEKFADSLTETIDRAFTTSGDFTLNITYEPRENSFIVLDETFRGDPYSLNFTAGTVTVHTTNRVVTRRFVGKLRLFDPFMLEKRPVAIPLSHETLSMPSGQDFVIEARTLGEVQYVFLYPDDKGESRATATSLYQDIQEFIEWDGEYGSVEYESNISFEYPIYIHRDHLYPINRTKIPIGTPLLNLTRSGGSYTQAMEVPAGTELNFRRSFEQIKNRTFIEYRVRKSSSSSQLTSYYSQFRTL